ncbi:hypothetical protein FXO38_08903 [Capsicum annuum]|nr:hypothetical protein FXO38_08903 [Capsicum annuum]
MRVTHSLSLLVARYVSVFRFKKSGCHNDSLHEQCEGSPQRQNPHEKTISHEPFSLQPYLQEAAKLVQPSFRGEGFAAIPNVKWEDVGGLHSLRHDFDRYIVRRIKNPKDYMCCFEDSWHRCLLEAPWQCCFEALGAQIS